LIRSWMTRGADRDGALQRTRRWPACPPAGLDSLAGACDDIELQIWLFAQLSALTTRYAAADRPECCRSSALSHELSSRRTRAASPILRNTTWSPGGGANATLE
jgi:hypothetical protein